MHPVLQHLSRDHHHCHRSAPAWMEVHPAPRTYEQRWETTRVMVGRPSPPVCRILVCNTVLPEGLESKLGAPR